MKSKRGFTLLEVIVTSVIMAMLFIGVFYFYKNSRIIWSSEQSKLDALHDVRASMLKIQRDLREAIILPSSPSNPTGYELKEFNPLKISFSRYIRYQGLKTEDITYEFTVAGNEAKLVRRKSGSVNEEVLLKTNLSEGSGTGTKEKYGLLSANPVNPSQKTGFIGIDEDFNPGKYDSQSNYNLKLDYLQKHTTYSKWKTSGIMITLIIRDVHGNISVFKSVVYPRSKSFSK